MSEIDDGASTRSGGSSAASARVRRFFEVNNKRKILNVYCKPSHPIVGDELFASCVADAEYQLRVHANVRNRDGPPHPRACLIRTLVMRVLADHPECKDAFELYADPRKGRHVAASGQVARESAYALRYSELPAPPGFCNCFHWSQCSHKPSDGLVLIKDAHYYGGKTEIDALRSLGYKVLVVGWHYNTSEEAFGEVILRPAGNDQYWHAWEGDDMQAAYLHALPSTINLGEGRELVRCGAYRATLYEPISCSLKPLGQPTKESKPLLPSGLTYEQLISDEHHGEDIRQIVAKQIDHKATHAANHFARAIGTLCQDPIDGMLYAQVLLDRVVETSRAVTETITLDRRADRLAHDARTRDATYEYDGPGFWGRLLDRMFRKRRRVDQPLRELTRPQVLLPTTMGVAASVGVAVTRPFGAPAVAAVAPMVIGLGSGIRFLAGRN